MADEPLSEETALVTGASAGIGRETARVLARDGATVALAARREDRLEALAGEIETEFDTETLVCPTDVTDEQAVDRTLDRTLDEFGGLDIVVNNAGIIRFGDVENLETEKYRQVMDVNCDGTFFVTRASIPHLRESAGTLIFVGSFAGEYPRPGQPVYAASKWWTRGFALSIAGDLGEDDVAVTVVNPTEVRTEIGIQDDRPAHERFDPAQSAEPEEVAEAIVFAARQEPPNVITELDFYRRDKFASFRRG